MDMPSAIRAMIARRDLSRDEMEDVMRLIMQGEATPAQIGGFLVGLTMKGETVAEIAAAARVMRSLSTPVDVSVPHMVDIVGTGGDGSSLFNVSTASCFVVAEAGGHVAKHGNRSVTSRSGSADLLEAAGVVLDVSPACVAQCIRELGVGFMFAPRHHGSMKHAIGPRREMGVRTVFNLLGPLTNPAGAPNMVLGVYDPAWLVPMAEVMRELGSRHVLVVHSDDGLDEISIAAPTSIAELRDGEVYSYRVAPEDFGLPRAPLDGLRVSGAEDSLALIRAAFAGTPGPAGDILALNAGAALYAAGLCASLIEGVARAGELLRSGAVAGRLSALVERTHRCTEGAA
ncbi:MAG: anthranilate phosphoribosyltransferase [Pseudomonadota bacterium]